MVKHFQEQDKIKTHKFTSDVHLAHYCFPILKQCKQVTYAFKTPLPLPHPPRSLSSYYSGVGGGWGKICNSASVTVLKDCKARGGWPWRKGRVRTTSPFPPTCLVPSRLSLAWPRSPAGGKGVIKPTSQILGVASIPSSTSLSGSYVTSHRVMATHRLIGYL